MSPPRVKSLLVVAFSIGTILLSASPAAAYNEENVKNVRMQRLDAVSCTAPIRITATLTDSSGGPVAGAEVHFSYKKSASGDSIAPAITSSDAAGVAETTIDLTCEIGSRIIRASVPGDGSAQLVVTCNPNTGCTIKPQGEVLGITGAPDTGTELIDTAPASQPVDDASSRWIGLMCAGIAAGALWLRGRSRRRVHFQR